MLFKNSVYLEKDRALEIWGNKIDSVDRMIDSLQQSNKASVWAIDFWHGVRIKLMRQLHQIRNG